MTIESKSFERLAAEKARSPEVARLFEVLVKRDDEFRDMWKTFVDAILSRRAAREGKPIDTLLSRQASRTIARFENDGEEAQRKMRLLIVNLHDDAALLQVVRSNIDMGIQMDESLFAVFHSDDKADAERLLDHQRRTLKMIDYFIESLSA